MNSAASMASSTCILSGTGKSPFIRGPKALTDSSPRWRGVRNCAKECGLDLDTRLILDLPESRDPMSSFEAGSASSPKNSSGRSVPSLRCWLSTT